MDQSCKNRKRQRKECDKKIEECVEYIGTKKLQKFTQKERSKTYRDRK